MGSVWGERDLADGAASFFDFLGGPSMPLTPFGRATAQFPGILFFNSEIGFGQIPDGTTNTLLVGERDGQQLNVPMYSRRASSWCGVGQAHWLNGVLGVTTDEPEFTLNSAVGSFFAQWLPFSSSHPGGANFGRADGSVTFVTETINGETFRAMGTRNGGEVFDAP